MTAPGSYPLSTTDHRASSYFGGQENLWLHADHNEIQIGLYGFGQQDDHAFDVLFNDGSYPAVHETFSPSGGMIAAYFQDTFHATERLAVSAGVRQTHFEGNITENATSPRVGVTYRMPGLNWTFRAFYGRYYQPPPLETLSGPLLEFAQASSLAFLPLHGERDTERQFGVMIPTHGWVIDADYFRTEASNFFDHNPIGDSDVFFPLTIQGAIIRAWELTVRSPRFWSFGQVHLAYSNQTADGFGAVTGGLTDFSPGNGSFALDHDQRNTVNVGIDGDDLPWQTFLSVNVYYGSGFSNGDPPPSHLPSHATVDLTLGKAFEKSLTVSLTALNLTDDHLLTDNSSTFGGIHYNNPRELYAEVRYEFAY